MSINLTPDLIFIVFKNLIFVWSVILHPDLLSCCKFYLGNNHFIPLVLQNPYDRVQADSEASIKDSGFTRPWSGVTVMCVYFANWQGRGRSLAETILSGNRERFLVLIVNGLQEQGVRPAGQRQTRAIAKRRSPSRLDWISMTRYSNKIDAKWLQTIFKTAIYILHLYCLQFVFSLNKHFLQMYKRCISIQSCFQSRPEICSQTRPGIYLYSL